MRPSTDPRYRAPAHCRDGYAELTLGALSKAANLPLSTSIAMRRPAFAHGGVHAPDRSGRARCVARMTDADPPRERLFDLLMARFEAMLQEKDMLRVVQRDLRRVPGDALLIAPAMIRAMRWMAEAAGLSTAGLRGAARVRALAAAMQRPAGLARR